jgi:predicted amidophosphoribosyltransferase
LYEQYVLALADIFFPQRWVGCDRRASDLLCRDCFGTLPRVGRLACVCCGTPTAFETFACDACKGPDFDFGSARADEVRGRRGGDRARPEVPRLHEGRRERLGAPLMLEVLGRATGRFDAFVPVPLPRSQLKRCGFNQAEVLARGVAAGRRGEAGRARFGYTGGSAQDAGPRRELAAGERRAASG